MSGIACLQSSMLHPRDICRTVSKMHAGHVLCCLKEPNVSWLMTGNHNKGMLSASWQHNNRKRLHRLDRRYHGSCPVLHCAVLLRCAVLTVYVLPCAHLRHEPHLSEYCLWLQARVAMLASRALRAKQRANGLPAVQTYIPSTSVQVRCLALPSAATTLRSCTVIL